MIDVKIEKIHPWAQTIVKAHETDAGYDICYCAPREEEANTGKPRIFKVLPGKPPKIPTGLKFEIPAGWCMKIYPKSGNAGKGYTIPNAPGIVDSGYNGEVRVLMWHPSGDFQLTHGQKIAQVMFERVHEVNLVEAPVQAASARGDGGFGSTGAFAKT